MNAPRLLYFAYSEIGYTCLDLLLRRGDNVVALVTHEDNPGEKIWFKTPAALAREHDIPVFAPETVKTPEWIERFAALQPDLILSVYYRHMIPMQIVELAPLGAFNLHGSLLPKFRGRAPVNWAVLHGARETGVTLHRMVKKPDAGAIVDQERVEIGPRDTAEAVFRKLLPAGRALLARQMDTLLSGLAEERPQDHSQATYFGGRQPEDGRIRWSATTAEIFNLVRAVTDPYPGAFTDVHGFRLMVWWAEPRERHINGSVPRPGQVLSSDPLVVATADGALEITRFEWRRLDETAPRPALQAGQVL